MKILITDLDNTLYDWVTFFSQAFKAMVTELSTLLNVPEEQLLDEFRNLHRDCGNSEQPFTAIRLPSVIKQFGNLTRNELKTKLDRAFHVFNSTREKKLCLYSGVNETLSNLYKRGVVIIGFTEAIAINGYYRLERLQIHHFFKTLYALKGNYEGYPGPKPEMILNPPANFIKLIPDSNRKPDPLILLAICKEEGIDPADAWYVGDSLTKDILMAQQAGIKSIWAKYGTEYDKKSWEILKRITHWSEVDVLREEQLEERSRNVKPDYTINSFEEVERIIHSGLAQDSQIKTNFHPKLTTSNPLPAFTTCAKF
ncbi:MAG: HAD family hydrolase [Candidatus Omnitrophota bacterium]